MNKVLRTILSISKTISSSLSVVPLEFRTQVVFVIITAIFSSMMELFSISLMAPVFYLLNDETSVSKNVLMKSLFKYSHLNNVKDFLFFLMFILLLFFFIKSWLITLSNKLQINFSYTVSQKIMRDRLTIFFSFGVARNKVRELSDEVRSIYTIPSEYATHILTPTFLFISELAVLILISVFLIVYNPLILFSVILICLPVISVIFYYVRRSTEKNSDDRKIIEPQSYNAIFGIVNGLNAIQTSRSEKFFIQQSNDIVIELHNLYVNSQVMQKLPQRIMETFVVFIVVLVYGLMIYGFKESRSELIAVLIMFGLAAYRLLPSVNNLISYYIQIKSSFFVVEDLKNRPPKSTGNIISNQDITSIELKNFTFSYEDAPILESIHIILDAGKVYGLYGDSGSGKSTLANVLSGNIEFGTQQVYINDKLGNHLHLRYSVNYVSSKEFMYDLDILSNIALGKTKSDRDEDLLDEIIDLVGLNDGYQSNIIHNRMTVGVTGANISDGQKQRIAIGRSLYFMKSVLILDEATNMLDLTSELTLIDNVMKFVKARNAILFIISHRIQSLNGCDCILQMERGKLIKQK